ncbi:MAG: cytochrome c biogenesis protein ResB [Vulcanimicrobiaceae bacterium]
MAALAPARSSLAAIYEDFLRTFSNVLFAVCLFIVWGILTLIGVIVDQGKDPAVYFASYAAPVARLILRLGFDNIYHSPAYVGIIGLILLSLAVCTFKRVIPARLPPLRPVKIDKIPLHASFSMHGDEASLRARIDAFFAARGWQVRKREFGGEEWTFADKHNWARRGVLVAHIGFVIIAAGTSIYWARGFSGDAAVLEGQTIAIPHTQTSITLHDFKYRIEPIATKSGIVYQPVDYLSNVTVAGENVPPHAATIRVNHPIDIDGTLFYQSSYGFGMRFSVLHDGEPVPDLSNQILKEGEALTLPQSSREIQYSQFVGTIDRATGMPSADPRTNNPGVVLNAFDNGQPVGTSLVPIGKRIDVGDGFSIVPRQYVMYSGLQYRYDPGIPLVGIGAFVLLAGLCISFYLLPARLYVKVERAGDDSAAASQAWTIGMAASTVKGYDIFEGQFHELAAALQTEAAS